MTLAEELARGPRLIQAARTFRSKPIRTPHGIAQEATAKALAATGLDAAAVGRQMNICRQYAWRLIRR